MYEIRRPPGSFHVRAADVDPDCERRPEPQQTIQDVEALA
jgi:hypothetical protein